MVSTEVVVAVVGGIIAAVVGVVGLAAPIWTLHLSRKWREADEKAKAEAAKETEAQAKARRLEELKQRYIQVQRAAGQLDIFQQLLGGREQLWQALQLQVPQVAPSRAAGGQQRPLGSGQQGDAAPRDERQILETLLARQRLQEVLRQDFLHLQDARNEIKSFWKDLFDAARLGQLPDGFVTVNATEPGNPKVARFNRNIWLYRANNFRQLVEPYDIANFYRLKLHQIQGSYLATGRNSVYRWAEQLWEHFRSVRENVAERPSTLWAVLLEEDPAADLNGEDPLGPLPAHY